MGYDVNINFGNPGNYVSRGFVSCKKMIRERGLCGIATVNPPVFDSDKENTLLASDVFIQTSRTEAMPMGILEALSYGLPTLVTEGTTLGSFINGYNAGWVAKCDAESIFECIKAAIDGVDSLSEKSEGAINLVKENFAWDKVAKSAVNEYHELIKS